MGDGVPRVPRPVSPSRHLSEHMESCDIVDYLSALQDYLHSLYPE